MMTPSEASVGISGTQVQIPCAQCRTELDADEAEDRRQAVAEVHQLRQRALQHEVQRPQAEQREGVRREDEERVAGDAVDRRHGVDGEDDVGREDGHDDQRERRGGADPVSFTNRPRPSVVRASPA
jgi:hypothetical protein